MTTDGIASGASKGTRYPSRYRGYGMKLAMTRRNVKILNLISYFFIHLLVLICSIGSIYYLEAPVPAVCLI